MAVHTPTCYSAFIRLAAKLKELRMKRIVLWALAAGGQALASSPPAVGGQPMRAASIAEAARSAKCIVAATPVKPVAAGTWEFSVDSWLRGSGAATVKIRGFMAPGFGGTSADAQAVPGRTVIALLSGCEGPTYSLLGPFVTREGRWVPTGVYEAKDFDERALSE